MYSYFSTSVSGTNPIIEQILKEKLIDVSIIASLDGLIIYNTESKPEDIKQLRGINNSFLLVKMMKNSQPIPVEKLIKQALGEPKILQSLVQSISPKQFTFRIVTSEENHMVSVTQALISQLEERLSHRSHLKPNRRMPQNEFWFLTRSEGYSLIGVRLTKNSFNASELQKGELSPEIAHQLCFLSEPQKTDVVLDPFAGSGAIPTERTNTKYTEIIAIEKDPTLVTSLKEAVTVMNKKITIAQGDATNLNTIKSASIDKIITDPPWGEFDQTINIPKLYEKMFTEFIRVIKPNGIIILLTGQKDETDQIIHHFKDKLKVESRYDILISGKKARIYKLRS